MIIGFTDFSSTSNSVAHFDPMKHNIHVIQALEENAAFFDLLIPGYKNYECTYYFCEDNPVTISHSARNDQKFNNQTIYFLHEIKEPDDFQIQNLSYS